MSTSDTVQGQPRSTGRLAGAVEGQRTFTSGSDPTRPTQPAGTSARVTGNSPKGTIRNGGAPRLVAKGNPDRRGAYSGRTGEVQR
jgi:hypothetical protein